MDGTGVDMTATGVDLTGWPSRVSPDSPEWEDYASRVARYAALERALNRLNHQTAWLSHQLAVAGQRSVRTHRRPDR
jgi:hypothetical protein